LESFIYIFILFSLRFGRDCRIVGTVARKQSGSMTDTKM